MLAPRQDLQVREDIRVYLTATQQWLAFGINPALSETRRLSQEGLHRILRGEYAARVDIVNTLEEALHGTMLTCPNAPAHTAALRAALQIAEKTFRFRAEGIKNAFYYPPESLHRGCALDDACSESQTGRRLAYESALYTVQDFLAELG